MATAVGVAIEEYTKTAVRTGPWGPEENARGRSVRFKVPPLSSWLVTTRNAHRLFLFQALLVVSRIGRRKRRTDHGRLDDRMPVLHQPGTGDLRTARIPAQRGPLPRASSGTSLIRASRAYLPCRCNSYRRSTTAPGSPVPPNPRGILRDRARVPISIDTPYIPRNIQED